jgi:hypothetical protein
MVKTDRYNIPTGWADLTLKQAIEITDWSKSEDKHPVKLLSIILSCSEDEAGRIVNYQAESILTTVVEMLNVAPEIPKVAPRKLLGVDVDIKPAAITVKQAWEMDMVVKQLKDKGMLNVCANIVNVILGIELEQLMGCKLFDVWATADFFLKSYRDGIDSQIRQLQAEVVVPKRSIRQRYRDSVSSIRFGRLLRAKSQNTMKL